MAAAEGGKGTGRVRLVELRGVAPGFPFYGAIELAGGQPYSHALVAQRGALVPQEFLSELGLAAGDAVRLAGQSFTIRGVVAKDRVQRGGGAIAFGPRIYIDLGDLRATSLLGFGSRAGAPDPPARRGGATSTRLTRRLRRTFQRDVVSVRSWRTLEDRLGRNLTVAENYLSLVGFAIVVLGGIGVWSVTRVIVQQKMRSVAILKCLGASSRQVLGTYVLLVLWLAAAGSLLGVVLAADRRGVDSGVGPRAAGHHARVDHGVGRDAGRRRRPARVAAVRAGAAARCAARQAAPAAARGHAVHGAAARLAELAGRHRHRRLLAVVAIWQAGSLRAGLFVSAGSSASRVAAHRSRAACSCARRRRSRTSPRFALRHAMISLARPGNQTRVILMAVGLGCFFILAVRALQANLLAEFAEQLGGDSPDLVLDRRPAAIRSTTCGGLSRRTRPSRRALCR